MTGYLTAAIALLSVALLHGAAAGIRASAGRDGRVFNRRAEGVGAGRGIVAVVVLAAPGTIAALVDATRSADRAHIYADAAQGMLVIYGPVAAATALAFVVARVAPWQVRATTNSLIIGGLEFMRPGFAWAGVAMAFVVTGDTVVLAAVIAVVAPSLLVSKLVIRRWYSYPARMPELRLTREA